MYNNYFQLYINSEVVNWTYQVIKRRIQQQAARVNTMGLPAIPTARASLRVDRIGG
jgi:hypothetical protein